MTFSIIARDLETGFVGVATATGKIAVGAQVPHLRPGVGAIATQGFTTNPLYAEDGMRLLEAGWTADEVVVALTTRDEGREWRQLIVMDRSGRTAGHTGSANEGAAGLIVSPNLAIAGNMLGDERVLPAMEGAYRQSKETGLAARLVQALLAGEHAGGDKRGTCSAALLVDDGAPWPLDLRVDSAPRPVTALRDLCQRSADPSYRAFRESLPSRSTPFSR